MKHNIRIYATQAILFQIALLMLTACERKSIFGQVVDNFGKPVPRAAITIDGSAFKTTSDEAGNFEIDYSPGEFFVSASKNKYLAVRQQMKIAEKVRHPLGSLAIIDLGDDNLGAEVALQGVDKYVPIYPVTLGDRKRFRGECTEFQPPLDPMAVAITKGARFLALVTTEAVGSPPPTLLGPLATPTRFEACPKGQNSDGQSWIPVAGAKAIFDSPPLAPGIYCLIPRPLFLRASCFRLASDAQLKQENEERSERLKKDRAVDCPPGTSWRKNQVGGRGFPTRFCTREGGFDGAYEVSWPNGQKAVSGQFLEGQMHGTWTGWLENGTKYGTGEYERNELKQGEDINAWIEEQARDPGDPIGY